MNKTILVTGAVFGLLAILFGAFGAHGLEKLVDADAVETFETGIRYQMYHALFLLVLGIWDGLSNKQKRIIFWLVTFGVLLFSFSIYLLALDSLMAINVKRIGFLTPIGGIFLVFGWFLFGFYVLTKKSNK